MDSLEPVKKRSVLTRVFVIPQNESVRPWLAAVLSLVVPGLGQVYLGQYLKGVALFFSSALLCFGLGLCNVAAAMDARSIAYQLQKQDVSRSATSTWLIVFIWVMRWAKKRFRRRPVSAVIGDDGE